MRNFSLKIIYSLTLCLFFMFTFFSSSLIAMTNLNPANPQIIEEGLIIPDTSFVNIRGGIEYKYLSDARIKFKKKNRSPFLHRPRMQAHSFLGLIAINFKERFDLYAKAAEQQMEIQFFEKNSHYVTKSHNSPYLEGGAKYILLEVNGFSLGVDGKYNYFNSKADSLVRNSQALDPNDIEKIYHYGWHVGVGVSKKCGICYPYVGVAYHNYKLKVKQSIFSERKTMRFGQRYKGGIFLGTSISTGTLFSLNLEANLINERSVSISGEVRF